MRNTTARRPRRGGSRRSGRRGSGRQPAPKKTLWQKILAFFSGKDQQKNSGRRSNRKQGSTRRQNGGPRGQQRVQPEPVEVNSSRLYVGNLSYDATESDLFELFNGVGRVQNAEVVTHRRSQRSKGFAFVEMQSIDEAKRAVDVLHDQDFLGRKLVVSGAKNDPAKAA